jgi:hypothetical protein
MQRSRVRQVRRWVTACAALGVALASVGLAPTAVGQVQKQLAGTYSQLPTFPFGDAMSQCDAPYRNTESNAPIVAIVLTSDNAGCWMAGSDGGIFSYGDARFHGSLAGKALNQPVVGMAATSDGGGYWLVAADGGIFSFGDAKFHGSMGGATLRAPITGIAADQATGGYWEVGSDGGVFSFDASFDGSMASAIGPQPNPITAIAGSPDGGGYLLLPTDPAVEPGVPGRSGFALARQEWVGDGNLDCANQAPPLIQGAQYLLIGTRVDGGNTSGYNNAINDFEQLASLPGMNRTQSQNEEGITDTANLNSVFGANAPIPCS